METYEYIGVDRCGKYRYYNRIDYYTCAECYDFYDNKMELRFECLNKNCQKRNIAGVFDND